MSFALRLQERSIMDEIIALNKALEFAKSNGMSREEVAAKAGVYNGTISKWLKGKTSPTCINLAAVINACGFNVDLFLWEA